MLYLMDFEIENEAAAFVEIWLNQHAGHYKLAAAENQIAMRRFAAEMATRKLCHDHASADHCVSGQWHATTKRKFSIPFTRTAHRQRENINPQELHFGDKQIL